SIRMGSENGHSDSANQYFPRAGQGKARGAWICAASSVRSCIMMYAAGVDGGGSKTLAVIVDAQGNERGRGIAGSSNYAAVGISQAMYAIRSALEEAVHCTLPLQAA